MSPSVTWVIPRHVEFKTNSRSDYYAFYAYDRNYKRYRIFSDIRFKPRFIHFLAAVEAGVEMWMPIEPKGDTGFWQIAIDYVDEEPPTVSQEKAVKPLQLSFEPTRRSFSSMPATKKQTFSITEDYATKADKMAKRLQYSTKSDYLANVVANHLDLCDQMDAIC